MSVRQNTLKTGNEKISDAEIVENFEHFEEIIYENLQKILETRPKNPVSKFVKMILEDAGLDKNGDPLPDREQPPKRKDKKDVGIYKLE